MTSMMRKSYMDRLTQRMDITSLINQLRLMTSKKELVEEDFGLVLLFSMREDYF